LFKALWLVIPYLVYLGEYKSTKRLLFKENFEKFHGVASKTKYLGFWSKVIVKNTCGVCLDLNKI